MIEKRKKERERKKRVVLRRLVFGVEFIYIEL